MTFFSNTAPLSMTNRAAAKRVSLAGVLAISSALSTGALAQTAEIEVDEIIVFGTKQNLTLQETQTSVSVFTQEDIEDKVLYDFTDILLRTPNVSASSNNANFSIRGISSGGVAGGTGRTSTVYIDGAPITAEGLLGGLNTWHMVKQKEKMRQAVEVLSWDSKTLTNIFCYVLWSNRTT